MPIRRPAAALAVAVVLALMIATPASGRRQESPPTLLRAGVLIDGTGRLPRENVTVVIRDGRIVETREEILVSVPSDETQRSAALAELHQALTALPSEGYAEVWVDHDLFPALCALMNGEKAWLMCIRHEDAGFSSRNPGYQGPPAAKIAYMLANGQVDEYPAAWSYHRACVRGAGSLRSDTNIPGDARLEQ